MPANEILEGSYNGLLHKRFAMPETAPSPTLAPEIVPVVVIENDRAEFQFLAGRRRGIGAAGVSAAVGQRSIFALQNPAGSGVLIVVEQCWARTVAVASLLLFVSQGNTAGLAAATKRVIDSRGLAEGNLSGLVMQGPIALVPGAAPWRPTLIANSMVKIFDEPIVLAPGSEVAWLPTADNIAMDAQVLWTERAILDSELR